MDIYRISSDLKFVNQIGATLNLDERMKLELALLKITETEKYDQILFWGKIQGIAKDYYIAEALNFRGKFEFPEKQFFWASDNFNFSVLPEINPQFKQDVQKDKFRGLFTGQFQTILIKRVDEEAQQQGGNEELKEGEEKGVVDSDDEDKIKVEPKNFTELDRLAYTVRAIENDCSVVPVGAFKLTPTHELRYNDTFKGLDLKGVHDLNNYQHFRAPQTKEKIQFIARDDALFHFNFLDPLVTDLPKGSWSLQLDSSKTNSTVRSLLWPGFVGFHRANSNIFGYAYFGKGIKNADLPFLL